MDDSDDDMPALDFDQLDQLVARHNQAKQVQPRHSS